MSYQVIARKYRPQRFSDVVGQEHVTRTLARAIEQNRIAHAYLFCGPRGTGKTTIARIFAKCLNCTDGPKVDFRDDDPRAQEITDGRAIDVLEIDGASNRGIDEIRELRETVRYAPATSRFKIYIVDEVHMLTKEAFNALLKTLEEPPGHVKFMFATTEPEKVLVTILSRCQRFDLRRIPVALIVQHLAGIARAEQVAIDNAALHAIARGADGGMRDAESALDQLISFCGTTIAEPDVLSMFGLTSQGQILSLAQALLTGEAGPLLGDLHELCKHGKDLGRLLTDLLGHLRNVLIFQVARGGAGLLEASEAEMATLGAHAALVPPDRLARVMEVLTEAEAHLRGAVSRKIFVEVALIRAMEARNAVGIDALLATLAQVRAAAGPAQSAPAPSPAPEPAPEQPPPAAAALRDSGAPAPGSLDELWHALVGAVGRVSPFARSYLLEAFPVSLAGKVFTIGFDPEFADHLALVDNPKNHTLISTKLHELGHPAMQVKFVVQEAPETRPAPPVPAAAGPAPAPAAGTAAPARAKPAARAPGAADFKNDPLIQKALEIFKGQIVEVRA